MAEKYSLQTSETTYVNEDIQTDKHDNTSLHINNTHATSNNRQQHKLLSPQVCMAAHITAYTCSTASLTNMYTNTPTHTHIKHTQEKSGHKKYPKYATTMFFYDVLKVRSNCYGLKHDAIIVSPTYVTKTKARGS